jgi:hypothetical protein
MIPIARGNFNLLAHPCRIGRGLFTGPGSTASLASVALHLRQGDGTERLSASRWHRGWPSVSEDRGGGRSRADSSYCSKRVGLSLLLRRLPSTRRNPRAAEKGISGTPGCGRGLRSRWRWTTHAGRWPQYQRRRMRLTRPRNMKYGSTARTAPTMIASNG